MIQIRSWNQIFDAEEGRPDDADVLSPDWDHTVLEGVGDFDSETDADGDLNTSSASPKIGTSHCRVVFDDANDAYGVINATAINQTEATVDLWFDPRDVAIESGKTVTILELVDGGGTRHWYLEMLETAGGNERIRAVTRTDSGFAVGTFVDLTASYHHLRLVLRRSSGAGNDDGFTYLRVDDGSTITTESNTGIDNDTRDWDDVRAGMTNTNSTTFGGGYDIDEIRVSESVSPVWITEAAAKNGSFGIAATIEDTTSRFFDLTDPSNETKFAFRLWIDPSNLTTATNDELVLCSGVADAVGSAVRLFLKDDGADRVVFTQTRDDDGNYTSGSEVALSEDYENLVELVWWASPSAQQGQGETRLRLNGLVVDAVTGVDNDTLNVDRLRAPVASGLDSGTSGSLFVDDVQWSNDFDISITPTIRLTSSPRDFALSSSQRNLSLTSSPRDYSLTSSKRGSHA